MEQELLPEKDPAKLIEKHLHDRGIKISKVADECLITTSHLSRVLKKERQLTQNILDKINSFLNTNFKFNVDEGSQEQE